jgi:hypothetical protein
LSIQSDTCVVFTMYTLTWTDKQVYKLTIRTCSHFYIHGKIWI